MKKSLLTECVRIARTKLHRHPELSCYCHYAFVVQHNRIVEWATNSKREPPRHYGYHRWGDPTFRPKFHAEIFAYKRAKGLLDNKPFALVNIRLTKGGEIRLSKPCVPCFEILRHFGCRKIHYSSELGFLSL